MQTVLLIVFLLQQDVSNIKIPDTLKSFKQFVLILKNQPFYSQL